MGVLALVCMLAPAQAFAGARPTHVAGRNYVGAQINASIDPWRQLNMLSMRVANDGKSVNIWALTEPPDCAGNAYAIGDRKAAIDKDGRFHAQLDFGNHTKAKLSATVRGEFTKTKKRGTVALVTISSKSSGSVNCAESGVHVTAIRPKQGRPGAGESAPNALFVGLVDESSSLIPVKLPMLALLDSTGTQVKRWVTDSALPCTSGAKVSGLYRIKDTAIQDNSFNGVTGTTQPTPDGGKSTLVLNATGTFGSRSLTGTWRAHEIVQNSKGQFTDDCDTGVLKYFAARVR